MTATETSGRRRAYDPIDLSSRGFWSTTAADRERSFAELRAERPVSWHPPVEESLMPDPSDPGYWAVTRRGDIVRLIVAEGSRFSSIADFYYREVVSRGMATMRALIDLAIKSGEIQQQGLADFPQIVIAPALVAVIWQGLFGKHAPLDASAMFSVHLDLIFGARKPT